MTTTELDVTPHADVPPEVAYGEVRGRFVRFIADTIDAGNVPDEIPLTGTVTLAPLVQVVRFPTTTPPRLAVADTVVCLVTNGDLCPPDGGGPGVFVIATDQPAGSPDTVQWRATFKFDGLVAQPGPVTFNVPAGGVVDLALVQSTDPVPPIVIVVSHEDALAAAQSAADAAADAAAAAQSAQDAADYAASGNPGPPGPAGPSGPSGTVSVGNTTTLAAGANATVVDTDPSASVAVLDFGIPQGAKGNKGDPGSTGPQGNPGLIVLSATAPVPPGTPSGTVILRTAP